MKHLIIALMLVSLWGCKSSPTGESVQYSYRLPPLVSAPLISLKAGSGDNILTSWDVRNVSAIHIDSEIRGTTQLTRKMAVTSAAVKEHQLESTIRPGIAYLAMSTPDYDYYTSDLSVYIVYGGNMHTTKGGVAVPKAGGKPKAFVIPLKYNIAQTLNTSDPITYTKQGDITIPQPFEGFNQTITYLGMSQGQLKFVYKEFNDDRIRDAFTQEFSYDYEPGREYGYKGAKFIVHEATPTSISITQTANF